ncbi:MAG: DMT family transporter [Bdellovibrio sp.]|nr:DMT family transporter [Bdellovibrio sp.]
MDDSKNRRNQALLVAAISTLLRRPRPKLSANFFFHVIPYSLLGVVINQASFLEGLRYTTPTNSSILNTLIPVLTLAFVTIAGKEKASLKRMVGFLLALAGVLVLRNVEDFSLSNQTLLGDSLTLLNCVSYAIFLTVSKKFISSHDTLWVTTWMFTFGSIGLTLMSIPAWSDFQMPELTIGMIACMIYSILGATLLAYLLNNWALVRVHSSLVALFIYVQPVVTSIITWTWFNEAPTPRSVVASVLIFAGMILSLRRNEIPTSNGSQNLK